MTSMMPIWSRIAGLFQQSRGENLCVRVIDGGFDLVSPRSNNVVLHVNWSAVRKIQTYKLDLLTTDCVCLLFEFRDGRRPVRVTEDSEGFADLFGPLLTTFPAIPPDWYLGVMTPAFEKRQRTLYDAAAN